MIKSFDSIPINRIQIDKITDMTLNKGDTLVLKFDQDIWELNEATQMANIIMKAYPNNNIITIFKGMELGVIHHEN